MRFLLSLFASRPRHRNYALLDIQGRCQAFKQCSQAPKGSGWVEIEEIRLNWLHKALPSSARVTAQANRSPVRSLLTT